MLTFDASSIVYAWDNYPIEVFPPLWDWLGAEVAAARIQMSAVAIGEVGHVAPDLHGWLGANRVTQIAVDAGIAGHAQRIKLLLGIRGDDYHPKGVDENDLLIIATALSQRCALVSNEAVQLDRPLQLAKCKIPATCNLPGVGVQCTSFLEYLKRSGQAFR